MPSLPPVIYAAGSMAGLEWNKANNWRQWLATVMYDCVVRSPMRGKEALQALQSIPRTGQDDAARGVIKGLDAAVSSQHGIMIRDLWDVRTCDILFVNLLHAVTVSIGTVSELAWAHLLRKPAILVMEERGIHSHPFVLEAAYVRVDNLVDGVVVARTLLNLPALEDVSSVSLTWSEGKR